MDDRNSTTEFSKKSKSRFKFDSRRALTKVNFDSILQGPMFGGLNFEGIDRSSNQLDSIRDGLKRLNIGQEGDSKSIFKELIGDEKSTAVQPKSG